MDYDFQRHTSPDLKRVKELDNCAQTIIQAADQIGANVVVVSEYGLTPVQRPVHLNVHLRREGFLSVRPGPYGEMLLPGDSRAFAVADHQLAHLYVRESSDISGVKRLVESIPGVSAVLEPEELQLNHPRSGELIVLAENDAWFTYYYWLDSRSAPDFANTVDIHRKPGYDPCELFATSRVRALARVAQKKLGFRYRMDIVPLKPELVGGSHGLAPSSPEKGPLVVGPGILPDDMRDFSSYCCGLLG